MIEPIKAPVFGADPDLALTIGKEHPGIIARQAAGIVTIVPEAVHDTFPGLLQIEPADAIVCSYPKVIEVIDGELGEVRAVNAGYGVPAEPMADPVEAVQPIPDSQPEIARSIADDRSDVVAAQALHVLRVVAINVYRSLVWVEEDETGVRREPKITGRILHNAPDGAAEPSQNHHVLVRRRIAAEVLKIVRQRPVQAESGLMANPKAALHVLEEAVDGGAEQGVWFSPLVPVDLKPVSIVAVQAGVGPQPHVAATVLDDRADPGVRQPVLRGQMSKLKGNDG